MGGVAWDLIEGTVDGLWQLDLRRVLGVGPFTCERVVEVDEWTSISLSYHIMSNTKSRSELYQSFIHSRINY